jgi:serine/threonine protein kinase
MHLNPFIAVLGLSGGELIFIFLALAVFVAVAGSIIAVVIWTLTKGRMVGDALAQKVGDGSKASATPPMVPRQTQRLCPQCRSELAPDAPQGLCPHCLARAAFETQAPGAPEQRTSALPISEIAKSFPQFEIIELLGQGGMGVVYKARQPQLDRLVALKILSPTLSRDPAFAERFAREARALARLNHPNIVSVYESGKSGDFYYLMMEFVDGLNLSQMQSAKKRLAPEEAFAIVPKICDALQYAHDEGVVHRDIKPANILIDKKGRVKIADFGLAKIAGREVTGLGLTQSRGMMGTPQYMAPEQLEKPLEVDHRADIFSLGVVFYEMLTGELPLGRFPVPSKKVHIDVRLDEIVLRTLEKEPELRYQQASDLKTHVETVVNTPRAQSEPSSASTKSADQPRPWWAETRAASIRDWEKWTKSPTTPHFSLLTIFGAMCAGFVFSSAYVLHFNDAIIYVSGFAATLIGWISIARIRHSNGKLYGLGLAVFDALVLPLLFLDNAILIVPVRYAFNSQNPPGWIFVALILTIVFVVALDWIIVRSIWRVVKTSIPTPHPNSVTTPKA